MMVSGVINCSCGQIVGFSTELEEVECPCCNKAYNALENETKVIEIPEPEEE